MSLKLNGDCDIDQFFTVVLRLFFDLHMPAIAWQAILKMFGPA
ncbi:MAG: hypothetical protein WBW94_17625 [Anaerolineales bacterium]